jgi:hypothetical protein
MATGVQRRTRWERVAALELPPSRWEQAWAGLRRGDVLLRIGLCVAAAVVLCVVIRGWYPPFTYRAGQVLLRDVVARAPFETVNRKETEAARDAARRQVRWVYEHDPSRLDGVVESLMIAVGQVLAAESYAAMKPEVWADFLPPSDTSAVPVEEESQRRFEQIRRALADDPGLVGFRKDIGDALAAFRERGLLIKQAPRAGRGSSDEIEVYPVGRPEQRGTVKIADVLLGSGKDLRDALRKEFDAPDLVEPVFDWLSRRLVPTLVRDDRETKKAMDLAAKSVGDVVFHHTAGESLVDAGEPLSADQVHLLRLEYEAAMALRPWSELAGRSAANVALLLALFAVAAVHVVRREPRLALHLGRLTSMLVMVIATVALSTWAAADRWRAELIPVLLFGQTVAIAYRPELALMLTMIVAVILALALGHGLVVLLLLVGVTASAVLQLGRIRSRPKLIYVGLSSGVVAFLLTICLAVIDNQPMRQSLMIAVCNGGWTFAAGFVMTGLLPFVEKAFGVLTDISLLELGDVSHPLLQQLVQRAPATYNHSITVGSIAEAAADAIGARGLLVRVGAYYHDVGKMLKPGYFVENQAPADNRHESLMPAMSTLVIIAHIKDGADLARQHGLPPPIIDFIEQHHGTTLVQYFYGRAHEQQQQSDPNGAGVDENLYRYPGPKPQTKEAGVLMLADAVESACRSLVDPAPARIASLVGEIAERRLDDGQFDESGLTLRELRTIEDSMIKSLIANYHGRVKYPDQKTA